MVAFAEPSRPTRRAPARRCEGSSSCAPGKNPVLRSDRNQQYSITALTNGSGTIIERYSYSAYGKPTLADGSGTVISSSAQGNRYTYPGREWDEDLRLYHYRARMYDPISGRFLGRDPIGFDGSPWGLYEYCYSRATNYIDPQGFQGGSAAPPITSPPGSPPTINPGRLPPGINPNAPIPFPGRPMSPGGGAGVGPMIGLYIWARVCQKFGDECTKPICDDIFHWLRPSRRPSKPISIKDCEHLSDPDTRAGFCNRLNPAWRREECRRHILESQQNWDNYCHFLFDE